MCEKYDDITSLMITIAAKTVISRKTNEIVSIAFLEKSGTGFAQFWNKYKGLHYIEYTVLLLHYLSQSQYLEIKWNEKPVAITSLSQMFSL